jgi:glutathione peroxidase
MASEIYSIPVRRIDGTEEFLASYAGSVLLIVNVASQCGLTPQYAGLERLYETYRDRGFAVLGFPANEFGGQEPGTNKEIHQFCETRFGVQFPMFEKVVVKGDGQHPLFRYLTQAQPQAQADSGSASEQEAKTEGKPAEASGDIQWNFEKFLVSRDGQVVARFLPTVSPEDPLVVRAVEQELTAAGE